MLKINNRHMPNVFANSVPKEKVIQENEDDQFSDDSEPIDVSDKIDVEDKPDSKIKVGQST